ncbi:hypothetical protein OHA04_00360 [Streptomyces sp. NBC_01590]
MTALVAAISKPLNCCCAMISSVCSRPTSTPVWVRVKNASGSRRTWSSA